MTYLILILLVLVPASCKGLHWAFWPKRHLPHNRVRHTRIRLFLRLHPGPGHATTWEIFRHWSRFASARKAKYARPSLSRRQRLLHSDEHSVRLGRAHFFQPLRLPVEEHAVIIAPPRTGKSSWLSSAILRYPGAVVSTTTRADVYRDTMSARREAGRVDTFNPQGIGRVPSTITFDVIDGCLDIATAIRRADAFALAVSAGGMEDGAFWASKTSDYLRALFYAAAYARTRGYAYGLANAARWALSNASREAEQILDDAGVPDWSAQVGELRGEAQKTAATVRMYMTRALSFMMDPALARAVTPRGDDPGFSIESFVRQRNTLYLIASGQGEQSPLAPLFACLTGEIHYVAGLVGSWSEHGRLTRPLLFALDEVTQICPVPLDQWMADSGGKGIQVLAVAHGLAQLRRRWGSSGAQVIQDCAGSLIVLPGVRDTETLDAVAAMCGTVAVREHKSEHHAQHPVMTPAMLRQLPDKRAVAVRGNRPPVIFRIRQVWSDRLYKQSRGHRTLLQRLAALYRRLRQRPPVHRVPVAAIMPPEHGSSSEAA
jgi:type IV secretion system protein VirD4